MFDRVDCQTGRRSFIFHDVFTSLARAEGFIFLGKVQSRGQVARGSTRFRFIIRIFCELGANASKINRDD